MAAGAFAMAGLIYVFQRKDLYALGRTAVLMGLLSYSFVTVTLVADLGLPWHFYAARPAMRPSSRRCSRSRGASASTSRSSSSSSCPIPLEHWGLHAGDGRLAEVVGRLRRVRRDAVRLHALAQPRLRGGRPRWSSGRWRGSSGRAGQRGEPIMLAIAAVTLSTMHQSSLGSLFLLMPDKLARSGGRRCCRSRSSCPRSRPAPRSSILMEMWIAKGWRRPLPMPQLAAMGQITFWSLLVYLVFRLGDMAVRGTARGRVHRDGSARSSSPRSSSAASFRSSSSASRAPRAAGHPLRGRAPRRARHRPATA